MDVAEWISIVVSLVSAAGMLGGAFYFKGRTDTKLETMQKAQDKTDRRLDEHDDELRDFAVKTRGMEGTLEAINQRTARIEQILQEAFKPPAR